MHCHARAFEASTFSLVSLLFFPGIPTCNKVSLSSPPVIGEPWIASRCPLRTVRCLVSANGSSSRRLLQQRTETERGNVTLRPGHVQRWRDDAERRFPSPASFRLLRLDQNQPYLPMSSALCHGQLLVYLQASHLALSTWAASTSGRGTVASKGRPPLSLCPLCAHLVSFGRLISFPSLFLLVLAPNMQEAEGHLS